MITEIATEITKIALIALARYLKTKWESLRSGSQDEPSRRVQKLQRILSDAADEMQDSPGGLTRRQELERAWRLHGTIPALLGEALGGTTKAEYEGSLSAVSRRDVYKESVKFLRRLAERISAKDLAPTFLMPPSFTQFVETEQ